MDSEDREHEGVVRVSAHGDPGDKPTLASIYRAHADFVWRAVLRLGIPEAQAEDAVQEVFIVVRKKLPQFRGDAAVNTWLYAIARGVCANLRRANERARRKLEVVPPPAPEPGPEEIAVNRDAAALVEAFLRQIPEEQRVVFEMVDIEGMRGPEVARALEMPLGSVYSRLRLARKRFEAFVDGHAEVGAVS